MNRKKGLSICLYRGEIKKRSATRVHETFLDKIFRKPRCFRHLSTSPPPPGVGGNRRSECHLGMCHLARHAVYMDLPPDVPGVDSSHPISAARCKSVPITHDSIDAPKLSGGEIKVVWVCSINTFTSFLKLLRTLLTHETAFRRPSNGLKRKKLTDPQFACAVAVVTSQPCSRHALDNNSIRLRPPWEREKSH